MGDINVLIVEDELLIAEDLRAKLENNNFEVVDIVVTGEEAVKVALERKPDLILMDIQLDGKMDGITAAQKIKEHANIPIVYLSDHEDESTVERAKHTHPAGYLSKPFKANDLIRTLGLAFFNASNHKESTTSKLSDRVFIRTDNQAAVMIPYKDILCLEADRAYSKVVTIDNTYMLSNNMRKVFEQFDNPAFMRVHRSYVVNINRITGIEGNIIKLGHNHQVQMSSNYREAVLDRLNLIK